MKSTTVRYLVFIIGLYFLSLGIVFIVRSTLGTTPISSLNYVLSLNTPITLGMATFLINMLLILGQFWLIRGFGSMKDKAEILLQIPFSFLFSAFTMESVSKAAYKMIEEVRRQFREKPGIMKGEEKPDYKSCVAISTTAALHEMLLPGLMAVIIPVVVGVVLGVDALGGLLSGSLVTGVLMAIFMSNAGGAWDNAKKYIETGHHGGKGSEAHKAAVVGDTVGDPFKDTSGPSINILIKLMTVVSLVFAPLFLQIGGLL